MDPDPSPSPAPAVAPAPAAGLDAVQDLPASTAIADTAGSNQQPGQTVMNPNVSTTDDTTAQAQAKVYNQGSSVADKPSSDATPPTAPTAQAEAPQSVSITRSGSKDASPSAADPPLNSANPISEAATAAPQNEAKDDFAATNLAVDTSGNGAHTSPRIAVSPSGRESNLGSPNSSRQLPPQLELLQLGNAGLTQCLSFSNGRAMARLPSGRTLDLVAFVEHSFSMLRSDPRKALNPTQSHNVSIFFQFFAYITFIFDKEKFPTLTELPHIMHEKEELNQDVVDVILHYVKNLGMSTQRNHRLDALTNISNLFTVLQNYISYEFHLKKRPVCEKLASSEHLVGFMNETVYLIRVRAGGSISEQMRTSFRKHLVEFWNAIINWKVMPQDVFNTILVTIIRHEDVSMVVGHLLTEIEAGEMEPLFFFKMLVETDEFGPSMRRESWRGLREKYLTMTLEKMLAMTAHRVFDKTCEHGLSMMDTLADLVADHQFLLLLMASQLHRDMLLKFFASVISNHSSMFGEGMDLTPDQRKITQKVASTLHTLYCYLNDDAGKFVEVLADHFKNVSTVNALLEHLRRFKQMDVLKDSPLLDQNDRIDFDGFIDRIAKTLTDVPAATSEAVQRYIDSTRFEVLSTNANADGSTLPSDPESDESRDYTMLRRSERVVEPFVTSSRGWALRSRSVIKSGSFVTEYTGEVIPADVFARDRKRRSLASTNSHVVLLDSNTYLDASRKGSLARCINHSCAPNCQLQRWTVGKQVHVLVFARKDINEGEELTADYADFFVGERPFDCRCGSSSCRGKIDMSAIASAEAPASSESVSAPASLPSPAHVPVPTSAPAPALAATTLAPPAAPAPAAVENDDDKVSALLELANSAEREPVASTPGGGSDDSSTATAPSSPVDQQVIKSSSDAHPQQPDASAVQSLKRRPSESASGNDPDGKRVKYEAPYSLPPASLHVGVPASSPQPAPVVKQEPHVPPKITPHQMPMPMQHVPHPAHPHSQPQQRVVSASSPGVGPPPQGHPHTTPVPTQHPNKGYGYANGGESGPRSIPQASGAPQAAKAAPHIAGVPPAGARPAGVPQAATVHHAGIPPVAPTQASATPANAASYRQQPQHAAHQARQRYAPQGQQQPGPSPHVVGQQAGRPAAYPAYPGNQSAPPHGMQPQDQAYPPTTAYVQGQQVAPHATATAATAAAAGQAKPHNYTDPVMDFNRARGFPCRACTHISIARGIQMHMNATSQSRSGVGAGAPPAAAGGAGAPPQRQPAGRQGAENTQDQSRAQAQAAYVQTQANQRQHHPQQHSVPPQPHQIPQQYGMQAAQGGQFHPQQQSQPHYDYQQQQQQQPVMHQGMGMPHQMGGSAMPGWVGPQSGGHGQHVAHQSHMSQQQPPQQQHVPPQQQRGQAPSQGQQSRAAAQAQQQQQQPHPSAQGGQQLQQPGYDNRVTMRRQSRSTPSQDGDPAQGGQAPNPTQAHAQSQYGQMNQMGAPAMGAYPGYGAQGQMGYPPQPGMMPPQIQPGYGGVYPGGGPDMYAQQQQAMMHGGYPMQQMGPPPHGMMPPHMQMQHGMMPPQMHPQGSMHQMQQPPMHMGQMQQHPQQPHQQQQPRM